MNACVVIEKKMEGFTKVNSRRQNARKAREAEAINRALYEARIPGALWTDTPLNRSHLPGIPYSYYDEEIVMIRQRTADLIERQRAEARVLARAQQRHHYHSQQPVAGGHWYTLDQGHTRRASAAEASQWKGIDE